MNVDSAVTPLRFTKMHGAGNDFVVIDQRLRSRGLDAAMVQTIAQRSRGVGCDQVLTIAPPRHSGSIASYQIWNADGSMAMQCGNGGRCVAAWLHRTGAVTQPLFVIDSPVGRHRVERMGENDYAIAMGRPCFEPEQIPMVGFTAEARRYSLCLEQTAVQFGAVSFGNPHVVLEVTDVDATDVATIGRALQQHPAFPASVNVSFAEIGAHDRVTCRVFERGAGETQACGSAACAIAAVLIRQARTDRSVTVRLPGGDLCVSWPSDDAEVILRGPVACVFEGQWLL